MGSSNSSKTAQLVVQPAFDPRITRTANPLGVGVPLQRGYMIWDKPYPAHFGTTGGPLNDGRDVINFMFNPSTVTADYNVANTTYSSIMNFTNPADGGQYQPVSLQNSVTFDLYFDRTFELNYGGPSSAVNDPAIIGCQADVYQFMQFTGITVEATGGAQYLSTIPKSDASVVANLGNQILGTLATSGVMQLIPCHVFFGNALSQLSHNKNSTNLNALPAQVQYYGYISEWTANFTHWTSSMVPIRCDVQVTLTLLSNPPAQYIAAVWRDNNTLGRAPAIIQGPYAPYKPPPNF